MSYRLLRVATNFEPYLQQFYAQHPGLAEQSYSEQLAAHLYNAIERADFFTRELRKLGYETDDVIADARPLQRQWAREHDIHYGENAWMADIVLAQIQDYQPDVLFLNTWKPAFDAAFVQRVRQECPSVRLVLAWVGEAHPGAGYFRAHDLVLSCAPDTVSYLQQQGITARQLHHAFDPQILERLTITQERNVDVGFVGHIFFGQDYHNQRAKLFYQIAQHVNLTIYGELDQIIYRRRGPVRQLRAGYYAVLAALERGNLHALARRLPRYAAWQGIKARTPYQAYFAALQQIARPPVYGLAMYDTLARFKICLNAHGPSAYASNMRLYEATGVGTCLLTDWKPNLSELFEPDQEIVTYRSAPEAVEKVQYLLTHDDERRAIAAAGQRRTLAQHTTAHRVARLHELIVEHLL